jgi:release factor glutamine methyltransferase
VSHAATNVNDGPAPLVHRFMGVELELSPDVLVPRLETELLGREAVARLRERAGPSTVIDMCCGSGNLALAIAAKIATAQVWAADLTASTVALARRNAERLHLAHRVTVRQGDLFAALEGDGLAGTVDLVVCNPPYISSARLANDSAHLLDAEPREAFDGGPYGISIQQRVIRDAIAVLKPGGWLLFEFGLGQDRQAISMIARTKAYDTPLVTHDADGTPRVAMARKRMADGLSGEGVSGTAL